MIVRIPALSQPSVATFKQIAVDSLGWLRSDSDISVGVARPDPIELRFGLKAAFGALRIEPESRSRLISIRRLPSLSVGEVEFGPVVSILL
jgi:hypothetical protein